MVDNLIRPANVTNQKLLSALGDVQRISSFLVILLPCLIVKQSC